MHVPLPTPVIVDIRATIQKFFLMFEAQSCEIRSVHLYDGTGVVQQFDDLNFSGNHTSALDGLNTFNLATPHAVLWGIGISFLVQASIGFDTVIAPRLVVTSAGGDYNV
jgi:hypothetical protein